MSLQEILAAIAQASGAGLRSYGEYKTAEQERMERERARREQLRLQKFIARQEAAYQQGQLGLGQARLAQEGDQFSRRMDFDINELGQRIRLQRELGYLPYERATRDAELGAQRGLDVARTHASASRYGSELDLLASLANADTRYATAGMRGSVDSKDMDAIQRAGTTAYNQYLNTAKIGMGQYTAESEEVKVGALRAQKLAERREAERRGYEWDEEADNVKPKQFGGRLDLSYLLRLPVGGLGASLRSAPSGGGRAAPSAPAAPRRRGFQPINP